MLKRVHIRGFKSLVDVEVRLEPLVVLYGQNASGKSNFLDVLQLLSRIAKSDSLGEAFEAPYRGSPLESLTFPKGGVEGLRKKGHASFSIEVDLEFSDSTASQLGRDFEQGVYGLAPGGVGSPGPVPITHRYVRYRIEIDIATPTGALRVTDEYMAALRPDGSLSDELPFLSRSYDALPPGTAGSAETGEAVGAGTFHLRREDQDGFTPISRGLPRSVFSWRPYPAYYPHFAALREELANWAFFYLEPRERMRTPTPLREVNQIGLMGEELASRLNTLKFQEPRQFKAVEKALHMIVPSITGIDISVDQAGEADLRLLENGTSISSRVVSEGTLRILGLLTLTGISGRPTLLGLEEPENGVHPRRVQLIAEFLQTRARSDTQVIVTTHSPTLADWIPRRSLYACRSEAGRTVIEPFSLQDRRRTRPEPEVDYNSDEATMAISERILRGDFDA